ncbi:hypothetical protein NBRC3279_1710 [Acetobacter pasteurianus NBRC 3279]|nr:hypothetical protein NBRC3279_1710 [Acetobacter pasteurianus NBRC 3279]GCD72527.1 hypothetical protein NBRC3284_1683 [Acetobacter pasteurianus NBRC 3284]
MPVTILDREVTGHETDSSGRIIDSQSIKMLQAKVRAYDAGEKIIGRKRHIVVDTDD